MKNFIILLFLAFVPVSLSAGEGKGPMPRKMSGDAILKYLSEKSDNELNDFIWFLNNELDKSDLSDVDLDTIIKRLLVIQEKDTYRKLTSFKGPIQEFYPNRDASPQCASRLRFQKIANGMRKLPMKERVAAIVERILSPLYIGYETAESFSEELVVAGADAVPSIIEHKPVQPYYRRQFVEALGKIGDPRGIDYIVEVLQTPADDFRFERPIAAKALAKFGGDKVIQALVAALKDETFEQIDRHQTQVMSPRHKPYNGRCYTVQMASAESLTTVTKKSWGLVFNEDFQTWSAWLKAEGKTDFDPRAVKRSPDDLARLIRFLFHRYMSARPNPWQPQNTLESDVSFRSMAEDLKSLGRTVLPLISDECRARIADTPLWKEELTRWSTQLLNALEK